MNKMLKFNDIHITKKVDFLRHVHHKRKDCMDITEHQGIFT